MVPFRSHPTVRENSKKKNKKIRKNKIYHYGNISSQNRLKRLRKLSFRYVPTRRVKENSQKIAKKLKNTIMESFQAKIVWKWLLSFCSVPTRSVRTNYKKIAKKFKKLKNTIMSSFQAKIGWKRQRKRENKNYGSVPFPPNG